MLGVSMITAFASDQGLLLTGSNQILLYMTPESSSILCTQTTLWSGGQLSE